MLRAWKEKDPEKRIKIAHEVLQESQTRCVYVWSNFIMYFAKLTKPIHVQYAHFRCPTAYVLLAEEEATTIEEVR